VETGAASVVETFPVSDVSPINPGKMGQDLDISHSANDAPRIALIAQAKIDVSNDAGALKYVFNTT
jgi:hypothetical protein